MLYFLAGVSYGLHATMASDRSQATAFYLCTDDAGEVIAARASLPEMGSLAHVGSTRFRYSDERKGHGCDVSASACMAPFFDNHPLGVFYSALS